MKPVINITDAARDHIVTVLTDLDKPYLVFGLKGGGCAGFEYFWEPADQELYDKNGTPEKDEFVDLEHNKTLIVDCTSIVYLIGSTIDYKTSFASSGLVVVNPNASSGCGCGTSVAF